MVPKTGTISVALQASKRPTLSRPQRSRGNVLAWRSKVRGSKDFSGRKNPEHKYSGKDFKL